LKVDNAKIAGLSGPDAPPYKMKLICNLLICSVLLCIL